VALKSSAGTAAENAWIGGWSLAGMYVLAALLGAALLFALEPLFVKMALPLFGGAPAVWNVAFAFFTAALLAGYLYAHALTRLPVRRQVIVHGAVLIVAAAFLPVRTAPAPLPSVAPEFAVFLLLLERIGLPFVALSATAPLVQSWFALGTRARDPYWLYAASNVGSIVALLAYPFVIEPFSGLALQSAAWATIYGFFALLMLLCGWAAATGAASVPVRKAAARAQPGPLADARRLRLLWVTLAAIPTLLMMGLTSHLTAEVASLPFVWTMPLALYLLAYAVAFSNVKWKLLLPVTPYLVLPLVVLLTVHETLGTYAYLALSLLAFFLLAMGTIGRLADTRPPPQYLTDFYLWVALGGALGGVFAAFVAPVVFTNIGEYPLAIVLSCMLLAPSSGDRMTSAWFWVREAALALGLGAAIYLLIHFASLEQGGSGATVLFWVALAAGVSSTFFNRRIRFGLWAGALLLYGAFFYDPGGHVIARERNFFGPKRVTVDPDHRFHFLISGETVHGVQALDPARTIEPLAYYSRSGPLGDVFAAGAQRFTGRNIAVVGLGIGTASCYSRNGQTWSFYEIDPAVVEIARNTHLFSLLPSCATDQRIVLGDARLSLEREPPRSYALIILDAYDSDQIPVHLLTREAFAVYLRQLAPDGVLAFHISNRHFDLAPVIAALADDAGLTALQRVGAKLSDQDLQSGKIPSSWVVVTRRGEMLPKLASDPNWHDLARNGSLPLWTDDYSSLARILR
jgi:hypothetical protein